MSYQRRAKEAAKRRQQPAGTVVAMDKPMAIGEVMMIPPYRFVIAEAITKEEFERCCEENRGKLHAEAQQIEMNGGYADPESMHDAMKASDDQVYYYRAWYLGRMQGESEYPRH